MMSDRLEPGLYIVATPIGNLGDLTVRAANVLSNADLILAEDTRVTGKLLKHIGAPTRMLSYNDHSDERRRQEVLARLGTDAVALVSDAGTPLISDPGFKLVRAAREAGHRLHTIPGPCAAVAALTLAGLPTDRFLFAGFLPTRQGARREAIAELADTRATLVFYESGPRLGETLTDLRDRLGDRSAAVARELTKLHEECVTGSLVDLAARYSGDTPKGEIVLVVGPPPAPDDVTDQALDRALDEALTRLSPSRAAAEAAEQLGIPRKRAYARALERSKA